MHNIKIKVLGIGGCGNNILQEILKHPKEDNVEYKALNTDVQALSVFDESMILALGNKERKGFGAGGNPEVARECALESKDQIQDLVAGADIVFLLAGLGKGTGSGATPVIAEIAKQSGALTFGFVFTPKEEFTGDKQKQNVKESLNKLKANTDALLIYSNEKLAQTNGTLDAKTSDEFAFRTLKKAIDVILEITNKVGKKNVDFADLLSITKNKGEIFINSSVQFGKNRAQKAAKSLLNPSLLENPSIINAQDIIVNITGSDITANEISEIIKEIRESTTTNPNIVEGWIIDENSKDLSVSLIASGMSTTSTQANTQQNTDFEKQITSSIAKEEENIIFQNLTTTTRTMEYNLEKETDENEQEENRFPAFLK
ncbi:cell division protein FtsZ [Mycoplasma procyoni]|uniref:cell division protein FtsZ n=1 Tax=Mycoplasma procyoni TaxID=568784 RepID=UPI00197CA698|nr:cell division protein FtsZ [Mycoplasma procyoni]MBN3534539.1 cell division FtsZ family protein [Mycoplasma procyoni]